MRRTLLRSPAIGRDLRRWLKSHPDTAATIECWPLARTIKFISAAAEPGDPRREH
jgi:hypothetical protein